MYFRLLMRTKNGVRISSRVRMTEAATASCIYKAQMGARVEIIPDTGPLRARYGELDRRAAAGSAAKLKAAGLNQQTGCHLVWDRRFCLRTDALEPTERIHPTQPRPAPVSPERDAPAWAQRLGYALGLTLFACVHPWLAARWMARSFWAWLVGDSLQKRKAPR